MIDHDAGRDIAQRSAHGGAWNANPFASDVPVEDTDHTVVNRPANQAHLATPGAALESARAWHAHNGAVDFLGLDSEIGSRSTPRAPEPPQAPAHVVQQAPDESWLLEMGEGQRDEAPLVAQDVTQESVSPSPLLNAGWKEEAEAPVRKRRLAMPLVACGAAVLALAGVALVRRGSPTTSQAPAGSASSVSQPIAQRPKPADSGDAAVSESGAAPVVVARNDASPGELGPIAEQPLSAQAPVEPPPIEVAPASVRELVAAPSSDDGSLGFDSLVEVEPMRAPPTFTNPGAAPADIAPGEAAVVEEPEEAATELPVDSDTMPSINDYVRIPGLPTEPNSSEPAPATAETLTAPPSSKATDAATLEVAVADGESTEPVVGTHTSAPVTTLEAPTSSVLAAAVESSTPVPALAAEPTPEPAPAASTSASLAAPSLDVVGPTQPGVQVPDAAVTTQYGPPPHPGALTGTPDATSDPLASTSVQERTSKLGLEQVLLLDDAANSMRRASAKDLQGMWTETTIPFESIGAATKLLTPGVGKVRVVLAGGEIFEGGLYAVGEGCVWLDTQYGRMGLAGTRVKTVQQIDSPKGTPALGAAGSQELAGMDRVRIRTPGGVFYGKVIERDAVRTTVVTDDGARLTLDTKDVELLSQVPTVTIKK